MINYDNLNYFYKKTIDDINKENFAAFNSCWHFIKECIVTINNSDDGIDVENRNVDLINNNIPDEKIKDKLHFIRTKRNEYEHGNIYAISINDINKIEPILIEFINYINTVNPKYFQFLNKITIQEDTLQEDCLKLCGDIETKVDYNYTVYNYGYDQSDLYFMVNIFVNQSVSPLFAIIHNILIRSDSVKISRYLSGLDLTVKDKNIIFKYEIMLLIYLCKYSNNIMDLRVNPRYKKLLNYAINDINYYCNIFNAISDINENIKWKIYTDSNVPLDGININDKLVISTDISTYSFSKYTYNSHVLLNNFLINYRLTNKNIGYMNNLVDEIFNIKNLRVGQIKALQELFAHKKSLMVILPTGYGKSLIYQLYSMLYPRISFIVSPDEFLINDQIENLQDANISRVSFIKKIDQNINFTSKTQSLYMFKSTINYIDSETLLSETIMDTTNYLYCNDYLGKISIDECHKTSIWAHQFNPKYFTLIKQLIDTMPKLKLLLLSATVARRVKDEISFQVPHLNVIQPCPLMRKDIDYDFIEVDNINGICKHITNRIIDNDKDCSDVPSLSIIINNDVQVLENIRERLEKVPKLKHKCMVFDGSKNSYRRFKTGNRPILLTTDEYLTGVNVPFLVNLFIVGMPVNKEWFYQQTGRVGRYKENGHVSVIVCKENNAIIEALINKKINADVLNNITDEVNHTNLSEIIRPIYRDYTISINRAYDMYKDIINLVYVSTGSKYGSVMGKMDSMTSKLYEYPVYMLHFIDLIKKSLYSYKRDMYLTYRFYINMEIDNGTLYFENILNKHVVRESYNDEILSCYQNQIYDINDDFMKLFTTTFGWLNENNIKLKSVMFENVYQLIVQNIGLIDSAIIEQDLVNYFSVDSNIDNTDEEIVAFTGYVPRYEAVEIEEYKDEEVIASRVYAPIYEHIEIEAYKNGEEESGKPIIIQKPQSLINDDFSKYTIEEILSMVLDDINSCSFKYKALLEREIEDKFSVNCVIGLAIYEVLSSTTRVFFRLGQTIDLDIDLWKKMLYMVEHLLTAKRKIEIDMALISFEKHSFYYRDEYYDMLLNKAQSMLELYKFITDGIKKSSYDFKEFLEIVMEIQEERNCIAGLAIYEMVTLCTTEYIYFVKFITDYGVGYLEILENVEKMLPTLKKLEIDEILIRNHKSRYFFTGFVGTVKRLVFSLANKCNY